MTRTHTQLRAEYHALDARDVHAWLQRHPHYREDPDSLFSELEYAQARTMGAAGAAWLEALRHKRALKRASVARKVHAPVGMIERLGTALIAALVWSIVGALVLLPTLLVPSPLSMWLALGVAVFIAMRALAAFVSNSAT